MPTPTTPDYAQATSNGQYHPEARADGFVLDGRTLYKNLNTRRRLPLINRGDNFCILVSNPTDGDAHVKLWAFATADGTYNGTETWRQAFTFSGGSASKTLAPLGYAWTDPIPRASLPARGTILRVCTEFKGDGTLVPEYCYLSEFDGDGAEFYATAGALPDRTASGADIPLVSNDNGEANICFRGYGPITSRCDYEPGMIAVQSWGNSLNRGDNDGALQRGYVARALEDLEVAYCRAGVAANLNGQMIDYGNDPVYDQIFLCSTHFGNQHAINELRAFTTGDPVAHALSLRTSHEGVYSTLLGIYPWLLIFDATPAPEVEGGSSGINSVGVASRLAYDDLLRTKTASGDYAGWFEGARFAEDPADPTQWRPDLGGMTRQMDTLHFTTNGHAFLARAFDPNLLGITDREVSPLMQPPFTALDPDVDGPVMLINVVYRAVATLPLIGTPDNLGPAKGLTGITFHMSGGDVHVIGGCVLPPTDTSRRYVATGYAILDRAIEAGETMLSAPTIDPDTCNLMGKGDKVIVSQAADGIFGEPGDFVNNSTYTAPGGGGSSSTEIDDNFDRADGAPGSDYDASLEGTDAAISVNRLLIPNGTIVAQAAVADTNRMRQTIRFILDDGLPNLCANYIAGNYYRLVIVSIGAPNYAVQLTPRDTVPSLQSVTVALANTDHMHELSMEEIPPVGAESARFRIYLADLGNAAGTGSVTVRINNLEWTDNPGTGDASKPAAQTPGKNGIVGVGSPCYVDLYKLELVSADTTPPAWPPDAPASGSGFVLRSGLEAIVPFAAELSVPLLPTTGIAGFASPVESARIAGDRSVLLTFSDAGRVSNASATKTVSYSAGAPGSTKLRDAVSNYATSRSGLLLRNDSEWNGNESSGTPRVGSPFVGSKFVKWGVGGLS